MSTRPLTATEQAIIRPLLEHREALRRELQATERGLVATIQAIHGSPEPGLRLQTDTMTLIVEPTPERAAAAVQRLIDDGENQP